MLMDRGDVVHLFRWFFSLLLWSSCQSQLSSHNITCPFSSDCQCSSTQCIGPIQVWCTAQGHFPVFTANSNCEVDLLRIDGEYDQIPEKALLAFTDRITKLELIVRSSSPLRIDPQAFQGSIGLFLERFELYDQRTVTAFPTALKTFKKLHTLLLNNTAIAEIPAQTLNDKILETLRISNGMVKTIDRDAFLGLPFLFNLQLPNNNLTAFPRDALLPVMSSLRSLDLSFNQISSLESGIVHGFDRLKSLNLSGNPLRYAENGSLGGLEASLTQLDLSKCQLANFPTGILNGLKMLKTLDLGYNHISSIPSGALRGMDNLAELNLRKNPIISIEPGAFVDSTLTTLTLYGTDIEELDLAAFVGGQNGMSLLLLTENPKLKKVYCSQCGSQVQYGPLEIHLYRNNLNSIDKSITPWLAAGGKLITDGNDFYDCNQTAMQWLAGAYKCFDAKTLIISNTWCALENAIQQHEMEEDDDDIYYRTVNRTSLITVLEQTLVDCRQFFEKSETKTTPRPTAKGANSASTANISFAILAIITMKSLVSFRRAIF